MKNFKFTSSLLNLAGLVMISMFVLSCSKDEVASDEIENQNDKELISVTPELNDNIVYLKPPKGFESKTEEEKHNYFNQLSAKEHELLKENYRISDYLKSQGLLEDIGAKLKDGELLDAEKLNGVLSVKQFEALSIHKPTTNKNLKATCTLFPTPYCVLGRACPSDPLFDRAVFELVCRDGVITVYYGYFCNIYCT
ncbi:hypothetical protein [Aquimarina sp. MMG016]|uniref:hypothetical protein n=1 Tax=Aquimarina sp. MMG016 TaxID=2822690 RepID=UPI001B3A7475|nr:hypothetical protein [Aquimarina sp. MMG016]MBQ4818605.1 hypothetical protein [Aquimarina sp. MMG016]